MRSLEVLGCSGSHNNYFCHFVNAASLPWNRLHLRPAYREVVEVELDRLRRPVLAMPIAELAHAHSQCTTGYLPCNPPHAHAQRSSQLMFVS